MIRSFVAVPVTGMDEIAKLAREMGSIRGMKGVRTENIHLTLAFLGDIDTDTEVPAVVGLLEGVRMRHAPFDVSFTGTGAFPNQKRMKVAWIGIRSQGLRDLATDVLKTLPRREGEGLRSFSPHLTIGRVKFREAVPAACSLLEEHSGHDFGSLHVDHFELMRSTLTPQGPIYEGIGTFPLTLGPGYR